ncbi:MAG: ATP-binding cassette domain-containing protein, partial [Solirubrobacteraceae bacterium]
AALEAVGLAALGDRHPRELSGGERQRLALAVVLDGGEPPCAVLLDEPTRGMDRAAKGELADRLRDLDAAVIVATHDAEFAAAVAPRVVLLADGRPVADAAAEEVLCGGWYFATETARIVGALTPEAGAERIRRGMSMEVPSP